MNLTQEDLDNIINGKVNHFDEYYRRAFKIEGNGEIGVFNAILNGKVNLNGLKGKSIHFENAKIQHLVIDDFCDRVSFNGSTIDNLEVKSEIGIVEINQNSNCTKLFVKESNIVDFYIKSSKFNSVIFENSKCDFTIENSVFVTFDLKNCNLDRLLLQIPTEARRIQLQDNSIFKLTIEGFLNEKSRLSIEQLRDVELFRVNNLTNKGELYFNFLDSKFRFKSKLLLLDSDLGNAQFRNCDFQKFSYAEISETTLAKVDTFNTQFPVKNVDGHYFSLYETYVDLYTISLKNNNQKNAAEYYKAAKIFLLKAYRESLPKDLGTWLSLEPSYHFSRFGTQWLRSLLVTVSLCLLIFIVMLITTNFEFSFDITGINQAISNISNFVKFLDPIHRVDFMDNDFKYSESNAFVILNYLGKIILAFGIFELIRSFRKLNRA